MKKRFIDNYKFVICILTIIISTVCICSCISKNSVEVSVEQGSAYNIGDIYRLVSDIRNDVDKMSNNISDIKNKTSIIESEIDDLLYDMGI